MAGDIAENGLSPIDDLLVIKKAKNFVVVEGNRRLAAIKLLTNPALADGTPIAAAIKRIAANGSAPTAAYCAIASSREEAEHWQELRHTGMGDGAGVVPWNTLAKHRFSHKPGTQAAKAIAFLEALEEGFPANEGIQELIVAVAEKRLTTLGRLVADPNFKKRFGLVEDSDGSLSFHFSADALQDASEAVLSDISTDVSVSKIKTKTQRSDYLKTVPEPHKDDCTDDPRPCQARPPRNGVPRSLLHRDLRDRRSRSKILN